ncbi:hypothetical protein M0802_005859 [Mischocyttarus mexicanus]|nr:hypothetical protein M0802_005859 [Mischocyttarus mexicanus]
MDDRIGIKAEEEEDKKRRMKKRKVGRRRRSRRETIAQGYYLKSPINSDLNYYGSIGVFIAFATIGSANNELIELRSQAPGV